MPLTPGTRLGPYEILSAIGAGGMGEVYRARDGTLHRDVALKVMPEAFASDPDRLARFRREAQVLAALNHPNIAAIYGFEESTSVQALVLELVEGPTLAEIIDRPHAGSKDPAYVRKGLPVEEALPIARQIAEALEAAHEQGIIHRDLKPANIKLRPDGVVKVLDFGLAKAMEGSPVGRGLSPADPAGGVPASQAPTITSPALLRQGYGEAGVTGIGMILGTAAYMAPEQAKGREADKRSDIWAFGVVLYEMLTGTRPFDGEDMTEVLGAVIRLEPNWEALPSDVPHAVRTLLQRCLVKDPRKRIADIAAALFVLDHQAGVSATTTVSAAPLPPSPLWRRLLAPTVAAIVVGAAVGTIVWQQMRPTAPGVTRFAIAESGVAALSVDQVSRDLMITPDGTHVVYKGIGTNDGNQLFVRAVNQLEPTPLTGLGSPRAPFSSPDGQWIGFVDVTAGATLKKVAITGGPALSLTGLDGNSRGATWTDDGAIIYATSARATGLQRVSSAGGEVTVLTKPSSERGETDHLWPQFISGSRAVLFTITAATGGLDASQLAVLDLQTGTSKVLLQGGSQAQYMPGGYLVYVAAGSLRAVAFDRARLEVIGTPVPVVPSVVVLPTGTAEFDVAREAGTLVYIGGSAATVPSRTLVWVDREGREVAVKAAPVRAYVAPRLSPDGAQVALGVRDQEDDVWVWNFARETLTRVTSDTGLDTAPAWMPDGRRVVFSSQAGGDAGSLFARVTDGTATTERLTQSAVPQTPSAVSPDGTRVLFQQTGAGTASDVMMLTLDKERRVQPLVQTTFVERNAEISPDGRWVAYQTNDSGQFQVSVRPFPDVTTGRWQVSSGGGTQPLWAPNGQELFYVAPDGAIMSVRLSAGATWTATTPTKIIAGPFYTGRGATNVMRTYDVSPDGKRFLMLKDSSDPGSSAAPTSIVVVQNWQEDLKRLVPVP